MHKALLQLVSLGLAITAGGCGLHSTSASKDGPSGDLAEDPGGMASPATGISGGTPSTPTTGDGSGSGTIQPGTLTAGTWDDNRNFDFFTAYEADPTRSTLAGRVPIGADEQAAAHTRFSTPPAARQRLDVALVVDTTGSMGDELGYLKVELAAIADEIHTQYPDADQRWAAGFYRDTGDDYLVRTFDFRTDVTAFVADLAAQSAGGGGDTPESPDAGLAAMDQLSWRADADVARVAFWIADAPHHVGREQAMADAIRTAAQADVHLYPIAASGSDLLLELTMRQSAQLTGGRYLFLTDDSGVGNAHTEPTLPCYFVTHLDQAMRRMLSIELSGVYAEPDAADVIRTGGDPTNGRCTLSDGGEVLAY